MSTETKRASLFMALEAAGVEVEDLLQDAVVRQRALNDYEEAQQTWLGGFEAAKLEENRRIQAELDRLTSQYMSRIQSNLDEVARAQDDLRNWLKQKQQEVQRITEAATYCVPQNGAAAPGNNLASVLERASVIRR
jgi:molecular chaperone GrpE (heat shock protein)